MRSSISAVMSSVTGFSNAMSRAANHICLWPPSSSKPASSRACASNSPLCRCATAVPATLSSKCCWMSPTSTRRIIDPKPSTVPMRVSDEIIGPRTPSRSRNFDCATFGYTSGHNSSGDSRISVPNCSRCACCHASIAGTRYFVRGDTYPLCVYPPWQRTPAAISGASMSSVASSSASDQTSWRLLMGGECKR